MKVGDYVRTNLRNEIVIRKVIDIIHSTTMNDNRMVFDKPTKFTYYVEDNKNYKLSPNIIDLIEVGDYVNGMKITKKFIDEETDNIELEFNNGSSYLYPKSWNYEARSKEYKIKSIVTKEQFSQMEYRTGE